MVFHTNPNKKSGTAQKKKGGRSYARYVEAMAAAAMEAPDEEPEPPDDPNDAPAPDDGTASPVRKVRKDSNWRTDRAVKSREKALQREKEKNKKLKEQVTTLKDRAGAAESRAKEVQREAYLDKKASREMALKTEEEHKAALQELKDDFNEVLQEAHAAADAEMAKRLAEEQARILDAREHAEEIREERRRSAAKAEEKIAKERSGHEAVIAHMENQQRVKDRGWEQKIAAERAKTKEKDKKWEQKIADERAENEQRLNSMQQRLDQKHAQVLDEKQRRRAAVAREAEKRKASEKTVEELYEWLDEMEEEVSAAKREARAKAKEVRKAQSAKAKVESVSAQRLNLLKDLRARLGVMKDELIEESKRGDSLERMQKIHLEIKRERQIGRRGGSRRWPVHIVLLICELLVNGTPPSAVPANLQTASAAFTGEEAVEVPSVNFVRECRGVLENLNQMLSGYRLGTADGWHQLFTDGTSRRQIAFQNLVIALMEDGELDPVIVSSCMFLRDETADNQVQSIFDMLDKLKQRLTRWREVTAREFPDRPDILDMIPKPESIDIKKLKNGGAITDTCNAARAARRKLVEQAGVTVHEQDCWHHLRNVWIKAVAQAVSEYMNSHLHESLESIAAFLRVSPDLAHVIRAYHKEFSLVANYPKGHGELFRTWMIENYPHEFLLHAERATGSRQDLICMGAPAIYKNRHLNLEFLDQRLRLKGNDNILQQNLFIILSSLEMVAVSRLFSILHVAIVMPFRWLAGNTHKLAHRNWGARSVGRAADMLHQACEDLVDDPKLIHDRSFMMNIFDELVEELPEFDAYLKREFETKTTEFVQKSQTKAVPYKELLKELFEPSDQDNKDSTEILETVGTVAAKAILQELTDEKKATWKYLSLSGSEFSFDHCPDEVKKDMLGMMATNDLAESSFAGVTAQVQVYGRIGMSNASAVSDVQRNDFLSRPTSRKDIAAGKRGLFHGLPEELKITAVMTAMEDAPETRKANTAALELQRKMRQQKEELAKQKGLEDAKDEYIESLIYHSMWNSDMCWKTVKDVTDGLKKLQYQKDKYRALKDNILIRYKGLGFAECKTPWSENGRLKTVAELAKRLKEIIKMQQKEKWVVPDKPTVPVPQRKQMAIMGTKTSQVASLDEKANAISEEFDKDARAEWKEREASGIGSVHQAWQQPVAPPVDDSLIGERIEFLSEFETEEEPKETYLRWCSGVVMRICDGTWVKPNTFRARYKVGEAAEVLWDPIDEENLKMPECTSQEPLDPRKWNKDVYQSWRKDLGDFNYGL